MGIHEDRWDDETCELTHKRRLNKNRRVSRRYACFDSKEAWVYNTNTYDSFGYGVSKEQYNINNTMDYVVNGEEGKVSG